LHFVGFLSLLLSADIRNRYKDKTLLKGVGGPTTAVQYNYQCAQDKDAQKESKKTNDIAKRRDRLPRPTFECKSHLKIRLQVINGILTAKVILRHEDNHIGYCETHIPRNILDIIEAGKDKAIKDVSSCS
jgi:hypothetical protein